MTHEEFMSALSLAFHISEDDTEKLRARIRVIKYCMPRFSGKTGSGNKHDYTKEEVYYFIMAFQLIEFRISAETVMYIVNRAWDFDFFRECSEKYGIVVDIRGLFSKSSIEFIGIDGPSEIDEGVIFINPLSKLKLFKFDR